jgi:hypothetical protein
VEKAEDEIPIGWSRIYKPIAAAHQALESLLTHVGPVSGKLQINEDGPGARELAQLINNKSTGGMYDALALCALQIEDDFPGGPAEHIEGVRNFARQW